MECKQNKATLYHIIIKPPFSLFGACGTSFINGLNYFFVLFMFHQGHTVVLKTDIKYIP